MNKTTVRVLRTAAVIIIMCLVMSFALFLNYFFVDFAVEELKTGNGIFDGKKMPNVAWLVQNVAYLMPALLLAAVQALAYCRKKDKDTYSYLERGIQVSVLALFVFCILLPLIINYGKGLQALSEEALKEEIPPIKFEKIGEKFMELLKATVKDRESEKYINYDDTITRWTLNSAAKILDPKILDGVIMWFARQIVPCIILVAYNFLRFDALKHPALDCGSDEEFDADEEELEYENRERNSVNTPAHLKPVSGTENNPPSETKLPDSSQKVNQNKAKAENSTGKEAECKTGENAGRSKNSGKNNVKTDKKKK